MVAGFDTMEMKKYKIRDILLVASYFTKEEGYHPVSAGGTSTKERVLDYLNTHQDTEGLQEYQSRAEQAVQWIKNEKSTDWIDNIRSYLTKKEVEEKAVGLVSSMFSGYDSYLRRIDEKKKLQKSEFQGQPKQSISFDMKSFKVLTKGKSKFNENKDFYLIQILDQDGNVYIWFADEDYSKDLEVCQIIHAKVKSHNERDGVKQTIIDVQEIV